MSVLGCLWMICFTLTVDVLAQTPIDAVRGTYHFLPLNDIRECVQVLEVETTHIQMYSWSTSPTCPFESLYTSGSLSLSEELFRVTTLGGPSVQTLFLFRYTVNDTALTLFNVTSGDAVSHLRRVAPGSPLNGVWRVAAQFGNSSNSSSSSSSSSSQYGLLRINEPAFTALDPLADSPAVVSGDIPLTTTLPQFGLFDSATNETLAISPPLVGTRPYTIDFANMQQQRAPATPLDGVWLGTDLLGFQKLMVLNGGFLQHIHERSFIIHLHYRVFVSEQRMWVRGTGFSSFNFTYQVNSTWLVLVENTAGFANKWTLRRQDEPPRVLQAPNAYVSGDSSLASFLSTLDPSLYTVVTGPGGCTTLFLSDDLAVGVTASALLQQLQQQATSVQTCDDAQQPQQLSTPAVAGIAVASCVLLLLIAVVLPLSVARVRRKQKMAARMQRLEQTIQEGQQH